MAENDFITYNYMEQRRMGKVLIPVFTNSAIRRSVSWLDRGTGVKNVFKQVITSESRINLTRSSLCSAATDTTPMVIFTLVLVTSIYENFSNRLLTAL